MTYTYSFTSKQQFLEKDTAAVGLWVNIDKIQTSWLSSKFQIQSRVEVVYNLRKWTTLFNNQACVIVHFGPSAVNSLL